MIALLAAQEQPATSIPASTGVIPTTSPNAQFAMPNGFPYGLSPYYSPNTAAGVSGTVNNGQIPGTNPVSINTTLSQTTATVTEPIVHAISQGVNINAHRGSIPDSLMEDAAEWYTSLSRDDIHTFDEFAAAFKSHYGFNTRLKPNREFLRSLCQKKDESFREYAQRWRRAAARVTPTLNEEEMTQTFLKTLKKDYVERMIIAAPSDFSEMVTMGTRLEEAVRDGIIVFEEGESSANASRKYGNGHHKKKETEVGMVSAGTSQSMATVAPINAAQLPPPYQYMQYSQHPFFPPFYHQYPPSPGQPQVPVNAIAQQMQQQPLAQQQQQQTRPTFPPIPMLYAELLPTLLLKGNCTTRQGCYALKYIVKKLIDQGKLTFENNVPHVLDNPLPNHAAVNMIETHEEVPSLDVRNVATPLNDIQSLMNDNYLTVSDICVIVPVFHDPPARSMPPKGSIEPLVIRLPGPVPYTSTKAIPYKYNATMIENGVEVPLASSTVISNIAEETTTLRSGKVHPPLFPKKTAIPTAIPSDKVPPPDVSRPGQSIEDSNLDEILRLIKRSDYMIVDQLLQTPSKISILSLLLSSAAHRNTLLKVLEQAYVDHEVTVDHFGSIVGNITACNNLWFGENELPEAGKYHNLALHISMNCKSDMLSVTIPNSTLLKYTYS
ncbi:uncharacterized protein [Medicago truncatula]|uniref:uncharacterized protein n=1 Tax=Medicago truncatula TaxID=3880 RepID=UPI001968982E|nr:uncharacterized protein LOC112420142 [Medicago truncatula]